MATRPTLVFAKKIGAPKLVKPTEAQIAELATAAENQTTDLTLLTRRAPGKEEATLGAGTGPKPVDVEEAPKVPEKPAVTEVPRADLKTKTVKYGKALGAVALGILEEETENPYKDINEVPTFPLATRKGFQDQILKVYSSFAKVPEEGVAPEVDPCKKLTAAAGQQLEMYEYQKFVMEYTRNAAPYRGLLVYHGLGSGKTCSAIAAAEALFSVGNKKIIVMTPQALRSNFIEQVQFCGFRHFRIQNHWVALNSRKPMINLFAREVLGIARGYLIAHDTVWVPDFTREPNFNTLIPEERKQISRQLVHQIQNRITFVNYNGITASALKEIACAPLDADGYGFFDNAVIIVDEIHNLTRLMQGVIEPYLTTIGGYRRRIQMEPVTPGRWVPALCKKVTDPKRPLLTNYKRGFLFYRLLVGARNSKILGLSGTPLINFPEEIAILANLLGGYIHMVSCIAYPASAEKDAAIKQFLRSHEQVDFEEVKMSGANSEILFTLVPEGMKKVRAKDTLAVQHLAPGETSKTLEEVYAELEAFLKEQGMRIVDGPNYKSEPLLPPIGSEFRDQFLQDDGITLKNTMVLRKRLQGLISYYRGSKKELMPAVTRDEIVYVPFSPYAQGEYTRVRAAELKKTIEQQERKGQAVEGMTARLSNLWSTILDISKQKNVNSYRVFSRQACNFAFPEGIARPRPETEEDMEEETGKDTDILDTTVGQPQDEAELAEALREDERDRQAPLTEDTVAAERDDQALDEQLDDEARERDPEAAARADEQPVVISELAPVPDGPLAGAAPTQEEAQAQTQVQVQETVAGSGLAALRAKRKTTTAATIYAKQKEQCRVGRLPEETYKVAIRRAKNCLKNFSEGKLRLFKREGSKTVLQQVLEKLPPDSDRLMKYSPKFGNILMRIMDAPGSSLVYSQFQDMEGIGIFSIVLEVNDFEPIVLEGDSEGDFHFSAKSLESLKKKGTFRYLSFTGKESKEVRSLALRIFNARYNPPKEGEARGNYPDLPPSIAEVLLDNGYTGNLEGELCRVFCITSAGAEGLSLRNVRRVHVMEPHWNTVRTDQVKGRAVRICSHVDLDMDDRTVEVFSYCSVFAPEAMIHAEGDDVYPQIDAILRQGDGLKPEEATKLGFTVPTGARDYITTTDEYMTSLGNRKLKILKAIQDLLKTNAVDCKINRYENEEEGLGCITIKGSPEQYAFHPILVKDIAETASSYAGADDMPAVDVPVSIPEPVAEQEAPTGEVASLPLPAPERPRVPLMPVVPKGPKKVKVIKFRFNGVPYLAFPIIPKGQFLATEYHIYARADQLMVRKLGAAIADAQGNLTDQIVFD